MERWIDNHQITAALDAEDRSVLERGGLPYCLSPDHRFCVLARRHAAWQFERKWRDANRAPEGDGSSRLMLNFFQTASQDQPGLWFKAFIPLDTPIDSLQARDADHYQMTSSGRRRTGQFSAIPRLMWDLMSGDGQSEQDIARRFALIWQPA